MTTTLDIKNYEQYILNENNKFITKEFIETTLKKYEINHKVKNIDNFKLAYIHISYFFSSFSY